jgi:hypothetical protein
MTIAETVYEKLKAAHPDVAQEVLEFLQLLEIKRQSAATAKTWDAVVDKLPAKPVFEGDPVEIQHRLRA